MSISINSDNHTCSKPVLERKGRPQKDQTVNCPRCSSTNTKFCYYNNYSLTQPRYFCKTCRRYWTEGGTLRNVPVGGGSRKNKRSIITTTTTSALSSSLTSSSSFNTHIPHLNPPFLSHFSSQNPKIHEPHDLNLAFSLPQCISQFPEFPKIENCSSSSSSSTSTSSSSSSTLSHLSPLELLKTGISTSMGLSSFVPAPMPDSSNSTLFTSGFPLQEFKVPHLSFPAHQQNNVSPNGRVFFPFGEVKQLPTTTSTGVGHEYSGNNNKGPGNSATAAYWNNGMYGSGGGTW